MAKKPTATPAAAENSAEAKPTATPAAAVKPEMHAAQYALTMLRNGAAGDRLIRLETLAYRDTDVAWLLTEYKSLTKKS
jgi:hypothetical protein